MTEEKQDNQGMLDRKVTKVQEETWERQGKRESQEYQDHKELMEQRSNEEKMDNQEVMDRHINQDALGLVDSKDHQQISNI